MVEQHPGIFMEERNGVDAIEEYIGLLNDRYLIPVATVAVSLAKEGADLYPELDAGVHFPRHRHPGHRHLIMSHG
jgi:hypothetical protein